MSKRIEAPGRSALWTEAALRCLTGIATIEAEDVTSWSGHRDERQALIEDGVEMAMDWATAFEAACVAAHEAEQEARRERVRAIGRFSYGVSRFYRVERVAGVSAWLVSEDGAEPNRMALVGDLLDGDGEWMSAPLDAPAPTTAGGEERA